jgi:hypothetical protein
MWKSVVVVVYMKTTLSKNQVSFKRIKNLITWLILTSPKKIYVLENWSSSHNIMRELELTGSHQKKNWELPKTGSNSLHNGGFGYKATTPSSHLGQILIKCQLRVFIG